MQTSVPDFSQRDAMWAAVDFRPVERDFPAVDCFVGELRLLYDNGKVDHRAFHVPSHPVLDWYLSRNQYHEVGFFRRFWASATPKTLFPQMNDGLNEYDPSVFSFCSPFVFGGSLAWILSDGGPYHSFSRGGVEAKRIGDAAAFEMIGGSYEKSLVYQSGIAWSSFFMDVAWDQTFIAFNQESSIVHVLLATDTD